MNYIYYILISGTVNVKCFLCNVCTYQYDFFWSISFRCCYRFQKKIELIDLKRLRILSVGIRTQIRSVDTVTTLSRKSHDLSDNYTSRLTVN